MSDEKIVKVEDVAEEYEFVRTQKCENCGLVESYKVELQQLVFSRGFPCDELNCVCTDCGHKKTYVFDITKIWEGYKEKFQQ